MPIAFTHFLSLPPDLTVLISKSSLTKQTVPDRISRFVVQILRQQVTFVLQSNAVSALTSPIDEEHSAMMLVQRLANRDLTSAEVEAMHLRKTRKAAIRDSLREAHER